MKYIINYNRYKLLNESLASARQKYGNMIRSHIIDLMATYDPTPTKKYLEFMCLTYLQKVEPPQIKQWIEIYDNLVKRNLVDIKDINQFKDWEDFVKYVDSNKDNKSKTEIEKITKEGAKVIYEDKTYLVLHITQHDACILYGKGTRWCITQEDGDYWVDYNKNSTFYFIINKTLPNTDPLYKVAVQVKYDEIIYWDATDKRRGLYPRLPQKIKDLLIYVPFDWDSLTLEEKIAKLNLTNYTILKDGSVDVDGRVDLTGLNLTKLPIKFNEVSYFDCSSNRLTSLEGAPQKVGGGFYCSENQLTSLEGAPKEVGGTFICEDNQLTSLEGAPIKIGGYFDCRSNQLTSLEGAPKEVGGHFNCSNNQLTTLKDGPKYVGEGYVCYNNQLTTLEGAPKKVGGDFNCSSNQLTTLEGAPKKVGNFNCSSNQLTSLEGAPIKVGGNFDCSHNQLTTLEGSPKKVGGYFCCSSNKLTSLEGSPEIVYDGFACNNNQLTSLEGAPKKVGGYFNCRNNTKKFTVKDVRTVSYVRTDIQI